MGYRLGKQKSSLGGRTGRRTVSRISKPTKTKPFSKSESQFKGTEGSTSLTPEERITKESFAAQGRNVKLSARGGIIGATVSTKGGRKEVLTQGIYTTRRTEITPTATAGVSLIRQKERSSVPSLTPSERKERARIKREKTFPKPIPNTETSIVGGTIEAAPKVKDPFQRAKLYFLKETDPVKKDTSSFSFVKREGAYVAASKIKTFQTLTKSSQTIINPSKRLVAIKSYFSFMKEKSKKAYQYGQGLAAERYIEKANKPKLSERESLLAGKNQRTATGFEVQQIEEGKRPKKKGMIKTSLATGAVVAGAYAYGVGSEIKKHPLGVTTDIATDIVLFNAANRILLKPVATGIPSGTYRPTGKPKLPTGSLRYRSPLKSVGGQRITDLKSVTQTGSKKYIKSSRGSSFQTIGARVGVGASTPLIEGGTLQTLSTRGGGEFQYKQGSKIINVKTQQSGISREIAPAQFESKDIIKVDISPKPRGMSSSIRVDAAEQSMTVGKNTYSRGVFTFPTSKGKSMIGITGAVSTGGEKTQRFVSVIGDVKGTKVVPREVSRGLSQKLPSKTNIEYTLTLSESRGGSKVFRELDDIMKTPESKRFKVPKDSIKINPKPSKPPQTPQSVQQITKAVVEQSSPPTQSFRVSKSLPVKKGYKAQPITEITPAQRKLMEISTPYYEQSFTPKGKLKTGTGSALASRNLISLGSRLAISPAIVRDVRPTIDTKNLVDIGQPQRQANVQKQGIIQATDIRQRVVQRYKTPSPVSIPSFTSGRTVPIIPDKTSPLKQPKEPNPEKPEAFFPPFSFERDSEIKLPKQTKTYKTEFQTLYTPSLVAAAFDIRGKRPSKFSIASGLGIRPILR